MGRPSADNGARNRLLVALNWAIALAVAIFSILFALGNISPRAQSDAAVSMFPPNGFALGEYAARKYRALVADRGGRLPDTMAPQISAAAQRAFLEEPTAYEAVNILALEKDMDGKRDRARQLMLLVQKLIKRNGVSNGWLIKEFGRANDLPAVLAMYDQTLRTESQSAEYLFAVLISAMRDERFVEPISDLLKADPPWASSFWRQLVRQGESLENVANLRRRLAGKQDVYLKDNDQILLRRLVNADHFTSATQTYEALANGQGGVSTTLIQNGDFKAEALFPPFDWETFSHGGYGAYIDPESQALEVSAIGQSGGVVARQLLRLEQGGYELEVRARSEANSGTNPLKIEMACVESDGKALSTFMSVATKTNIFRHDFALNKPNCEVVWLFVIALATADREGYDYSVDSISLLKQ